MGLTKPLVGNRAIEDAAIDWVMELERMAGRSPIDRRYVADFPGDIESPPYTIEVKAVGASARGFGLPLEAKQVEAAERDPNFVLDVVENVSQGDPRKFVHRRFAGDRLKQLLAGRKARTYYEVPIPVALYDIADVHPSLAGGPVVTPDGRPDWAKAVQAERITLLHVPGVDQPITVARVEFERWNGPALSWHETYGKTPVVGADGSRSCAEVELVARLRRANWDAFWIDSFGQAPAAWRDAIGTPSTLPTHLRDRFLVVDRGAGTAMGGRWDIVAWRGDELLILESKGAGDKLRPKQIDWLATALRLGWPSSSFGVVDYRVRA